VATGRRGQFLDNAAPAHPLIRVVGEGVPVDNERVDRRAVARLGVAGLVLGAAAVSTATGWVDWPALGQWLAPHLVVTGLSVVAVLLSGAAVRRRVPQRRWPRWLVSDRRVDRRVAPLSWWMVAAAAVVVAGVAWGATDALLHEANGAKDPAAARVDAIKTGLSIGAGTGGVFALLLAVRRQWHQELTATDATLDPVRLGGLYALRRLAQDNPGQRQTIVDVVCAYLRMHYDLPGTPPDQDATRETRKDYQDAVQEKQVRLTAQRILATHLRPGEDPDHPAATFWPDTSLDLTGATLIDFDLTHCRPDTARFDKATFTGVAGFAGATFTGVAGFRGATFTGVAGFDEATFTDVARFDEATFAGDAWFDKATFADGAGFRGATFTGVAGFDEATFTDVARFDGATFADIAEFDGATFTGSARFRKATFANGAWFDEATFTGVAGFDATLTFTGQEPERACWVRLDVPDDIENGRAWPAGWAVVPTAELPTTDAEGVWGRLVKQAQGPS
jgi:uncharacterized protein YjbI with pentapeptide repeats